MLLSESDEPSLKTWLEQHLSKLSDAEAPILAEYCIALLKHDQDEEQVRQLCVDQLSDFLKGNTQGFVNDVFTAITKRTFVKGGSLSVKAPRIVPDVTPSKPVVLPDDSSQVPLQTQMQFPPMPMPPPGMLLDANFLNYMQPMQAASKKRKHCFAFEQKGYCHRGATCPYEHVTPQPVSRNPHEYDPNHSAMGNGLPTQMSATRSQPYVRNTYQNQVANESHQAAQPRERPDNKMRGADTDRAKTTLVVENIPPEHFSQVSVSNFFQTFGALEQVQIDAAAKQAIITFKTWDTANAAYSSPEPIFNNRFVKLYWQKHKNTRPKSTNKPRPADDMEVDSVALESKQREHSERAAKKLAMTQRIEALAAQKAELHKRQEEERARIKEMEDTATTMPGGGDSSRLALEAQLRELKAKATTLGLTAEDLRGSGRGTTSYRGRGAARGRGRGAPYVAARPRTLDLRPRTIKIKPAAISPHELEQQLRATTEYEEISVESDGTVQVTFQTRREAEVFSTRKMGEMQWVRNDTIRSVLPSTTSTSLAQDVAMSDEDIDRYDD